MATTDMSAYDRLCGELADEHEARYGNAPPGNWKNPRKRISPLAERDDLHYATVGAWHATKVLRGLAMPLSELEKMTLLDLGCGTGKVTRILRMFVKEADGWDPEPECIKMARKETARCPIICAWWPPAFYDAVPPKRYDLIVCTDVIPGVNKAGVTQLCETIGGAAKPGTLLVANIHNFQRPAIDALLAIQGMRWIRVIHPGNPTDARAICMYLWCHDGK